MVETAAELTPKTIELPRFGTCTYTDADMILFPWGLPGFINLRRFLTIVRAGQEHFIWLQSLDDPRVALPAADPWLFFPEYDPQLPVYARSSLALDRAEDFITLGVMVIPPSGEMTMNLLAPIVINLKARIGRQVPLETGGYQVRTVIPPDVLNDAVPAEALAE